MPLLDGSLRPLPDTARTMACQTISAAQDFLWRKNPVDLEGGPSPSNVPTANDAAPVTRLTDLRRGPTLPPGLSFSKPDVGAVIGHSVTDRHGGDNDRRTDASLGQDRQGRRGPQAVGP